MAYRRRVGEDTELEAAVEALYDVFVQPLPDVMGYCDHCDDASYEAALHGPVRGLAPDLVEKYAWDAIHHTGNEDDFRHFVPRLLELGTTAQAPLLDLAVPLGCLTQAGWSTWPTREQDAVIRVLVAFWDRALADHPGRVDVEDVLLGLASAFGDLTSLQEAWAADERLSARRHLRDLVFRLAPSLAHGLPSSNPWWVRMADGVPADLALQAWLQTVPVHDALVAAAEATGAAERDGFELAARIALDPTGVDEASLDVGHERWLAVERLQRDLAAPGRLPADVQQAGGPVRRSRTTVEETAAARWARPGTWRWRRRR